MKLLSPQVVRDTKASEQAREILRTNEINKASEEARKKLAQSEADFSSTIARQQRDWAKEQEEHQKFVKEMSKEVGELEDRKIQALIPIEVYEKKAKETLHEAQEALRDAKEKELAVEDLQTRLEAKLDDLGAKEQDLSRLERTLNVRSQETEQSVLFSRRIMDESNKAVTDMLARKSLMEHEFSNREKALILFERTLEAREERLKLTKKSLETLRKQLEDQRGVLEREDIRRQKTTA